ncbi:11709_t:CDS:2, partial [Diversispora eburnea]
TCHRCHAEEHLVLNCPIAKRQKKINERKTKDFEKYGYINQEDPLKNIMNMLETIKQDIVEIKTNKKCYERVQYLEKYTGYNLEKKVDHMIENEEEEKDTTENGKKKFTEKTKKLQETQMEQIENTVKILAELIPELKKSNDKTQERLSRMEQLSILSKHREQTKATYSQENQQS